VAISVNYELAAPLAYICGTLGVLSGTDLLRGMSPDLDRPSPPSVVPAPLTAYSLPVSLPCRSPERGLAYIGSMELLRWNTEGYGEPSAIGRA